MDTNKIQIFEQKLDGGKGTLSILVGGLDSESPKGKMDRIVKEYTGNQPYNDFIEIFLDNPYVRVIISGINDIVFDKYDPKIHSLKKLKDE